MAQQAADAALDAFARALAALQKQDWNGARSELEFVIRESDRPELKDRARQYLVACQARASEAETEVRRAAGVDPYLAAVFEKNRGNLAGALALCQQDAAKADDERFAYLTASIHALEGRLDEAARALRRAIELNPTNRVHAFHDPDFAELRHERELQQIFGLA